MDDDDLRGRSAEMCPAVVVVYNIIQEWAFGNLQLVRSRKTGSFRMAVGEEVIKWRKNKKPSGTRFVVVAALPLYFSSGNFTRCIMFRSCEACRCGWVGSSDEKR